MALNKTTIIPTDNLDLARQQFKTIVCGKKDLIIVVLGNDAISDKAADCADTRASVIIAGIERKVVWIKDRSALADEIKKLKAGTVDISKEDLATIAAFSVSLDATTMDIVRVDDIINFLRMESAFEEAGTA
ncbi:MAG: hypothetical protein NTX44_00615 [Ignavibacteriales bacterium]|nr:hypothetical protein [Ignavibacteriales bacterium]